MVRRETRTLRGRIAAFCTLAVTLLPVAALAAPITYDIVMRLMNHVMHKVMQRQERVRADAAARGGAR